MTKKQKLLKKLLSGSRNIRFHDFITLIEAFGFVRRNIKGSHHVYRHPRVPEAVSVQPTKNAQAKSYQVRQFVKLIEKYSLKMNED